MWIFTTAKYMGFVCYIVWIFTTAKCRVSFAALCGCLLPNTCVSFGPLCGFLLPNVWVSFAALCGFLLSNLWVPFVVLCGSIVTNVWISVVGYVSVYFGIFVLCCGIIWAYTAECLYLWCGMWTSCIVELYRLHIPRTTHLYI